jgi:hypothetical protein
MLERLCRGQISCQADASQICEPSSAAQGNRRPTLHGHFRLDSAELDLRAGV